VAAPHVSTDVVELKSKMGAQFRATRAMDNEIYFNDGTAVLA
jgi:hypothetical protein